eukprot:TRINITY_DN8450_c0_g1_i1.p1 TRINITY_DN8450_c0_g1~~TRINITY_DN8450_c0_g1_i1.p1  ORF type:complete len:915 (-),score=242.59 TRINITY_DN8450_c0_g1_i1:23-2377(-)
MDMRAWEDVSGILMQDLVSSDVELRLAAVRMLPYLPGSSLREVLASCEPLILQSLQHQDPHVRAEAADALLPMLTPPTVDSLWKAAHQFVKEAWRRTAEMVCDAADVASTAAFRAVRALLQPSEEEAAASVPLRTTLGIVCEVLVSRFPMAVARFSTLPGELRYPCPVVLAYLAMLQRPGETFIDDGLMPLEDTHPALRRVLPLVEQHFLPALNSHASDLVIEVGHVVLQIADKLRRDVHCRPWRLQVADALLSQLQVEDGRIFSDQLLRDVAKIARQVDAEFAFAVIRRVLDDRDLAQLRFDNGKVFAEQLLKDVTKLAPQLEVAQLKDIAKFARQINPEFYLVVMRRVFEDRQLTHLQPEDRRWFAAQLLEDVAQMVASEVVRTKLLYLLCCYMDVDNMEDGHAISIMVLLKRRLRSQDSAEVRAQRLIAVRKQGWAGANDVEDLNEARHMDLALQCALQLGVRCSAVQAELCDLLDEVSKLASVDAALRENCASVQRRVRGMHALPSTNTIDIPGDRSTALQSFLEAEPIVSRKIDDRAEADPVVVSGSSDPVHISCYHTVLPAEQALLLHVRVQNITDLEIAGVRVVMGITGCLDLAEGQVEAAYDMDALMQQEEIEFTQRFKVTSFSGGNVLFQLSVEGSKLMRGGVYKVHYRELCLPTFGTHSLFLERWQRLPYAYMMPVTLQAGRDPANAVDSLKQARFSVVSQRKYGAANHFSAAAASQTCFGDHIALAVTGASDLMRWDLRIELRASTIAVLDTIKEDIDSWLADSFGNTVTLQR